MGDMCIHHHAVNLARCVVATQSSVCDAILLTWSMYSLMWCCARCDTPQQTRVQDLIVEIKAHPMPADSDAGGDIQVEEAD